MFCGFSCNSGFTANFWMTGLMLLIFTSCSESAFEFEDISDELSALSQTQAARYGKIGISDAANDGIDEFYFLEPTVAKNPKFSGRFHPDLLPVVEISDDFGFERLHQVFTRNDPAYKISVDRTNQHYVLNWNSSKNKAEKGKIYRVRVRIGEKVMGYMDVAIVPKNQGKLDGGLTPLQENQSLKIQFRLEEKHCPANIIVEPESADILVGQAKQFIAKVYNYYGELLDNIKVKWSLENEEIASINKEGKVSAIAVGTTKIVAKASDVAGAANLNIGDDNCYELGTFTDPRDGQIYKTIKIGKQIWFAQNLNYNYQNQGCAFNREEVEDGCPNVGAQYHSLTQARLVCPDGWHLPDNQEWRQLGSALLGTDIPFRSSNSPSVFWSSTLDVIIDDFDNSVFYYYTYPRFISYNVLVVEEKLSDRENDNVPCRCLKN